MKKKPKKPTKRQAVKKSVGTTTIFNTADNLPRALSFRLSRADRVFVAACMKASGVLWSGAPQACKNWAESFVADYENLEGR